MKRFAALVLPLFLLVTLALSGCTAPGGSGTGKSLASGDVEDSRDVLTALNGAQTISLKKDAISWGDRWEVRVDGKLVATIKGEAIYVIGDTYSMYSIAGNLVGRESEEFRIINRRATIYGYDGAPAGALEQDFNLFLGRFRILDTTGKVVGTAEQNFNITLSATIKDRSGNGAWSVKKALWSWGASLEVTSLRPDSSVPGIDAVWMAVAMNEIHESQSSRAGK